jgi:hypothetical protein
MLSSPNSTNDSSTHSETISEGEESTNTETDLDDNGTHSETESSAVEPTSETGKADLIKGFESHLLYILRGDLDLAARLIPEFHRRVNIEFSGSGEYYHSAASHEQNANASVQEASITSSNGSAYVNSDIGSLKRGRSSEDDEEDNDGGSKRPRPDPGQISRNFASPPSGRRPTFACHFHKFNPEKYGPLTNRKFRTCIGPGPSELRRIKYSLLSFTDETSIADKI